MMRCSCGVLVELLSPKQVGGVVKVRGLGIGGSNGGGICIRFSSTGSNI